MKNLIKNRQFSVYLIAISLSFLLLAKIGLASPNEIIIKDPTYAKAIEYVVANNIFQGYPDGEFKENNVINRAELLKILVLGSGLEGDKNAKPCFEDMQDLDWFKPYVCKAKDLGFVHGYEDGSFRGMEQVNLAEAIKMLFLLNDLEFDEEIGERWYSAGISQAEEINILPRTDLLPEEKLSRGESAELIARFQNYQNNTLKDYLETEVALEAREVEQIKEEDSSEAKDQKLFDPLSEVLGSKITSPIELKEEVLLNVPFTSQAPKHNWSLPYSEACEEAALIMVDYYSKTSQLTVDLAEQLILEIVKWETDKSYIIDISAQEMKSVSQDYLKKLAIVYENEEVNIENIKWLLQEGYPVIIPIAGQHIGNSYYLPPGPPYHVIVIIGYNNDSFVINDPGTQFGEQLQFSQEVILNGIHNWAGSKKNVLEGEKAMLIIDSKIKEDTLSNHGL